MRTGAGWMAGWVLLAARVVAAAPASPPEATSGEPIQILVARQLMRQREEDIDVARVALVLSTLFDSSTDVDAGSKMVDALAQRVAALLAGRTDPELRIRAINTVLYREQHFSYDVSDMMGGNVQNQHLWGLLTRKKGNCVVLPVLWLAIAQRLGFPVSAVNAPQHMFLRYEDGDYRSNIEATSGGGNPSDEKIIRELAVPQEAIASGNMMKSLSRRELVRQLVLGLATIHLRHDDLGTAAVLLEMVLEADPRSMEAHYNLAIVLTQLAAVATSIRSMTPRGAAKVREGIERKSRMALSHARQATALGAVPPLEDEYWKKVQKVGGETQPAATAAAHPFRLEEYLQPGGSPIMLTNGGGILPSFLAMPRGGLPGDIMAQCASMCGPQPGNLCALLAPRFR